MKTTINQMWICHHQQWMLLSELIRNHEKVRWTTIIERGKLQNYEISKLSIFFGISITFSRDPDIEDYEDKGKRNKCGSELRTGIRHFWHLLVVALSLLVLLGVSVEVVMSSVELPAAVTLFLKPNAVTSLRWSPSSPLFIWTMTYLPCMGSPRMIINKS